MSYKIMPDETPRCLECGDPILYGRPDKKFCCCSCKNRWHNGYERHVRIYKAKVRRTLDKNYEILGNLMRLGIDRISLDEIRTLGYDPRYVTFASHQDNHWDYQCYDILFRQTGRRLSRLRREPVRRRASPEKSVSLPDDTDENGP